MPLRGGLNVWIGTRRYPGFRLSSILPRHGPRRGSASPASSWQPLSSPHYLLRPRHHARHSSTDLDGASHNTDRGRLDLQTPVTYLTTEAGTGPNDTYDDAERLEGMAEGSQHKGEEPPPSDQEILWDIVLIVTGRVARYHERFLCEFAGNMSSPNLRYLAGQLVIKRNSGMFSATVLNAVVRDADFERLMSTSSVGMKSLEYWAWILAAPDSAERAARFLSDNSPKPGFLLGIVLRGDALFTDKTQLQALVQYAFLAHWRGACAWAPDKGMMRWFSFVDLIGRFAFHCRRRWPGMLPLVALLAQSFLLNRDVTYRDLVDAYNWMLQIFGRPAFHRAAYNMQHNWRAQQTLLTAAERLGHDLLMERETYRSVRIVLLACKKTFEEQDLATRHLDSWPPYVPPRDNMDERREPEYDYSSAVRIGFMMQGAGFEFHEGDVMLDIIGGRAEDDTVTIRQRRPLSEVAVSTASQYNVWAARVSATRNAREAWMQFQRPPEGHTGAIPVVVYGEMFAKLLDPQVESAQIDLQPGDGPVEFPTHPSNLSDYGEALSQPPKLRDLYFSMLKSGVRPEGYCLYVLLRNPRTLMAANGYLINSALDRQAVQNIMSGKPLSGLLHRIDIKIVFAYVKLLCRMQPNHKHRAVKGAFRWRALNLIGRAYRIMIKRVNPTEHPTWFRSFGYQIIASLSRPDILLNTGLDKQGNRNFALAKFMGMLAMLRERSGIDVAMFESLRRIVQNNVEPRVQVAYNVAINGIVRSFFHGDLSRSGGVLSLHESNELFLNFQGFVPKNEAEAKILQLNAIHALKVAFREMVAVPVTAIEGSAGPSAEMLDSLTSFSNIVKPPLELKEYRDALWRPPPQEAAQAAILHRYMRTLAFIGDWDEMMWLLSWMAGVGDEETTRRYGSWDENDVLDRERGWGLTHSQQLRRALCAFRAFAEPALVNKKDKLESLVERVKAKKCQPRQAGETLWSWPTDEDLDEYLSGDTRDGMGGMLRKVIEQSRVRPDPWVSRIGPSRADVEMSNPRPGRSASPVYQAQYLDQVGHDKEQENETLIDKEPSSQPQPPSPPPPPVPRLSFWQRLREKTRK